MLSSETQALTDANEIGTLNQSVSNIEREQGRKKKKGMARAGKRVRGWARWRESPMTKYIVLIWRKLKVTDIHIRLD